MSLDAPIVLNEAGRTPFEEYLCNEAGEILKKAYPGFTWAVKVEEANGMFYILNQDLSGEWGYRGKVASVYSATAFRKEVLMAGGGILEHFGVARAAIDYDKLVQLPTDFSGRVLPSNMPSFRWQGVPKGMRLY
jgi:hypothetical protein